MRTSNAEKRPNQFLALSMLQKVSALLAKLNRGHTHLLVSELAEMEKNVAPHSLAIALPIIVLPVPGGPNRSRPLGGPRSPVKISGL